MAGVVTITGNVFDHSRVVIPAAQQPELWFRPDSSRIIASLLAGVESKATLSSNGEFTIDLVSDGDEISYTPVLRWLVNPAEPDMEKRSYGYVEFPPIWPDTGGPIGDLTRPAIGWVWISERATLANGTIRAEFQYNPVTTSLYRRVLT